ncbi:MAG: NAD-dependent epimerase/dehydratase family protein [Cyclobacteriaceae bacterium]|nr:NAD-dependent epimerase/dehydratase family protein [Cyclobacteriaceae bacterium]
MKRRQFVHNLLLGSSALMSLPSFSWKPTEQPLNILILGGTQFVGPALVKTAIARGHQVSLLNRGVTDPDLFPELPLIKADRLKGIEAYNSSRDQPWDVIIDVWPEKSQLVDEATQAYAHQGSYYVFISSIAVYENFQEVGLHEASSTVSLEADPSQWYYSEEKLKAEQLVAQRFPNKHLILRPGPIKGWRDPALDLLYWLVKLKRNESMLLPGSGDDPLQFIDVKAVAQFALMGVEQRLQGVYNTTGPQNEQLTWKEFIDIAKTHLNSNSKMFWAPESFLQAQQVRSFEDLPLWAPISEDAGFMQVNMDKAQKAGFQHINIQDTFEDCLFWFEQNYSFEHKFGVSQGSVGLTREKELELIAML